MRTWFSGIKVLACCSSTVVLSFIFTSTKAQEDITYTWQIPKLNGYRIHDEANILTEANKELLEKMLKKHEDSTSNQIAILTLSRLSGNLEDYSLKVANEWKLGQKDKNNGVLITVVTYDHQIRIEVGKGLEGVLNNDLCSRIISAEMAPHFKKKNYDAGMVAAASAIIKGIGGTYKADKPAGFNYRLAGLIGYSIIVIISIFGLVSRDYFPSTFGGTFPFHLLSALSGFISWWTLLGFLAGLLLLRLILVKSKMKLLKFGSAASDTNDNGDASGEDLYNKVDRRNRAKARSSSSGSRDNDRFSGGGGSFGGRGSSGSW